MCGIFGCVGKISEEKAWECIKRIEHRGPDALQVKQLPQATLAHARLAIIDTTEAANQPFSDETERYWIVFNGEIYNYIELRKELQSVGYSFRTKSDTEVLLKAYIHWGEEAQNKCNGMWGAAIWDTKERKLFLSRDRFGIKPLYYYEDENGFYFGSEMKSFFSVMKQRNINYRLFDKNYDYFSFENGKDCTIQGIQKLLPGNCAILLEGKLHVKKWWETLEHLIDVPERYEEQVELFRELFLDACKIRMRSDVPLGTALSGGVDSSTVIGAMSYLGKENDVQRDWQHAFVGSMPYSIIDETAYAKKAAEHIGISLTEVPIHAHITPEEMMNDIYMCEDPIATIPRVFLQTYKAIKNSGVSVSLDGHGADELFGGYVFDLFYYGREVIGEKDKLSRLYKIYNETCMSESRLTEDEFFRRASKSPRIGVGVQSHNIDAFNKILYEETHQKTLPTLLRNYDRYSMANSVEIRMPFMDYRIVSFAFSIPAASKIQNDYLKAIVRDMAMPFMSKEVLYRKLKLGFNSPLTEWFHGELKEFLVDTVSSKEFYECELINPLLAKMYIQDFYMNDRRDYSAGEKVWTTIAPYLWKKAVIDCG
ncbi:MAG: asparagine synthase (glutamine-hydrolyzing) [Lachnospiraceae bacterium]|nr:asparagine synthase (glutamine-hydrolyzing) [Lachnospiraceae bacterium]